MDFNYIVNQINNYNFSTVVFFNVRDYFLHKLKFNIKNLEGKNWPYDAVKIIAENGYITR